MARLHWRQYTNEKSPAALLDEIVVAHTRNPLTAKSTTKASLSDVTLGEGLALPPGRIFQGSVRPPRFPNPALYARKDPDIRGASDSRSHANKFHFHITILRCDVITQMKGGTFPSVLSFHRQDTTGLFRTAQPA